MANITSNAAVSVEKTWDKVSVWDMSIRTNPLGPSTFVLAYRKYAANEDGTWDMCPEEIEPIQRLQITIPDIVAANAERAASRVALLESLAAELVLVGREQGLTI